MRHAAADGLTCATAQLDAALACLDRSESTIRAWQQVDRNGARRQALALPDLSSVNEPLLRGAVVGVKDVIDVAGLPTGCGSRARAGVAPATADATVVARLRQAGAVILGKVKTTEFAYTDPTDTANPANPQHTPGGSSSGSAAAVAAGSAMLALGTQTVGSVCRPAAYCGVAAFKPTTGSMPATGVVPFARSFDTVGFFAKDIDLALAAFRCCAARPRPSSTAGADTLAPPLEGRRIGLLSDSFYADCDSTVMQALDTARQTLERGGARIISVRTACDHQALREDQRTMMFREAALAHPALLESPELLGPNWRSALEQGVRTSETAYWEARDRLADARHQLGMAFTAVDALLLPPVRSTAPKGLDSTGDAGLIVSWTVFGAPLAVIPVGRTQDNLPTAVMIAGMPWTDCETGELASRLQAALSPLP